MKTIKKYAYIVLIAVLFIGTPSVFLTSCSSSEPVMVGVPKQKLKNSHKIGGYKVKSNQSNKNKKKIEPKETKNKFR